MRACCRWRGEFENHAAVGLATTGGLCHRRDSKQLLRRSARGHRRYLVAGWRARPALRPRRPDRVPRQNPAGAILVVLSGLRPSGGRRGGRPDRCPDGRGDDEILALLPRIEDAGLHASNTPWHGPDLFASCTQRVDQSTWDGNCRSGARLRLLERLVDSTCEQA